MSAPTLAEIDRIVALPDPVVRNLWITQSYAELSVAFGRRTGDGANWCTFATWASKQAGQTIREEDLARLVERELDGAATYADAVAAVAAAVEALGAGRALAELRAVIRDALDVEAMAHRASAAVARGNLRVFDEIARLFAAHESMDAEEFDALIEALPAGDPPDGQSLLKSAFHHYRAALATDITADRAELLVLANLEIGLHEQIRLQPDIAEALNVAVPDAGEVRARIFERLLPGARPWLRLRLTFWRLLGRPAPLDAAIDSLVDSLRAAVRRAVTSHVMTLALPGAQLHLGTDIGARDGEPLPPARNPELVALIARVDPRPDDARGSGAVDWADLHERMHFIAELFRRYHGAPWLHGAPFTDDQLAELRAGRRPADPL